MMSTPIIAERWCQWEMKSVALPKHFFRGMLPALRRPTQKSPLNQPWIQ